MKRISIALLCASLVAIASNACDEGDAYYAYGSSSYSPCSQYTSCGSCTPILGCGWCFEAKNTGHCAAGPSQCDGTAFSWTWEKSGCHLPADAGVKDGGRVDGAVSTPEDAAPPTAEDAALPVDDAAPPVAEDADVPADDATPD